MDQQNQRMLPSRAVQADHPTFELSDLFERPTLLVPLTIRAIETKWTQAIVDKQPLQGNSRWHQGAHREVVVDRFQALWAVTEENLGRDASWSDEGFEAISRSADNPFKIE